MLEGAFAFVILTKDRLYCVRDKYGLRPLSIGSLNGGYIVASETCALDICGAHFIRDVNPGEVVVIDNCGLHSYDYSKYKHHNMCAMEYIYFSRPDSDIEGINVHAFRKETGKLLYKEAPVDADIVIGVPDSSLSAAIGYSEASHIPYEIGLVKNKYVGRTFIQPSQEMREKAVRMKLSPVSSIVKGKRIVLIDDSIVRGTQLGETTKFLYDSGALEVHVRPACPPIMFGCKYLNFSRTSSELELATRKAIIELEVTCEVSKEVLQEYANPDSDKYKAMVELIRKKSFFTSLDFARLDELVESIGLGKEKLCTYCWDGREDDE